jgi:hypothetical protein|tara:strand:+ start:90 stop:419 length:330 start_codon:yes stop_codon:yes gene_type:complete
MKAKEYKKLRDEFILDTFVLSDVKRVEYTEGNHNDNVLWNFESIADKVNLTPLQVLSVYYQKHNSSINNYFKDGKEYSEPIEGRIQDMINYLLLMVAMIRKYKKRGIDE